MDRLLRPKVFETEITAPNAEKLFKHWKVTFENYMSATITPAAPAASDDADEVARATTAAANVARNKKHALINNVSADIYELISDCSTYETAMAALEAAYVRPTSIVFNRHQLITSNRRRENRSIHIYKNFNNFLRTVVLRLLRLRNTETSTCEMLSLTAFHLLLCDSASWRTLVTCLLIRLTPKLEL